MKIFCIGRNYVDHISELNNEIPEAPVVFMKPQTALLTGNKPFYYPNFTQNLHYECEIVLRICKNGKSVQEKFAHTYYDAVTVGIDFTARDLQDHQKAKGLPWEIAKAFDHSAVVGQWQMRSDADKQLPLQFCLAKNQQLVQQGQTSNMMYPFDKIIAYISMYFSLNTGDLIFTGTPKGVGPVQIGDVLSAQIADTELLNFEIK
ncbi:MAG: fumarylacetoacetate hydrolase family protein [Chitinophagaceae bacterium]|nr:fumarylacetoacetate hydrolase family protein [Chitinophagaceae bacterium]